MDLDSSLSSSIHLGATGALAIDHESYSIHFMPNINPYSIVSRSATPATSNRSRTPSNHATSVTTSLIHAFETEEQVKLPGTKWDRRAAGIHDGPTKPPSREGYIAHARLASTPAQRMRARTSEGTQRDAVAGIQIPSGKGFSKAGSNRDRSRSESGVSVPKPVDSGFLCSNVVVPRTVVDRRRSSLILADSATRQGTNASEESTRLPRIRSASATSKTASGLGIESVRTPSMQAPRPVQPHRTLSVSPDTGEIMVVATKYSRPNPVPPIQKNVDLPMETVELQFMDDRDHRIKYEVTDVDTTWLALLTKDIHEDEILAGVTVDVDPEEQKKILDELSKLEEEEFRKKLIPLDSLPTLQGEGQVTQQEDVNESGNTIACQDAKEEQSLL